MRLRRLWTWLTVNDVSTDEEGAYPEIRPLPVDASPDRAYERALAEARETPRWTIVSERPERRAFAAEARTHWLGFVDDVEVRVTGDPEVEGRSRIHVRSRSRVGRGDLGTNARRIRSYLERLASPISSRRRRCRSQ